MSKCNFTISFPGSAEEVVGKARSQIETQGGNFQGNTSEGNFSVKVMVSTIRGTYLISGQDMEISILAKPIFISCSQIESFLRSHIA